MSWFLPPGVSTYAGDIDALYYMILVITGLAFVIVEVALILFIIRYRKRDGHRAYHTHGNVRAEVIWTAIPAVVVIMIGVLSGRVWGHIRTTDHLPEDVWTVRVMAKQFEWNVTYPGPDGVFDTDDDFTTRNQLHMPANRPVRILLEAEEVIHSFFVPAFRVKQDAVPGMTIPVWVEVREPGEYEIACAELCGLGHYRMRGMVTVHPDEGFDEWQRGQHIALTTDR